MQPLLNLYAVKLAREGATVKEKVLRHRPKGREEGSEAGGGVGQRGQRARPLSLHLPPLSLASSEWPQPRMQQLEKPRASSVPQGLDPG